MRFEAVIFDLGSTLIEYENHPWDELGLMGCTNACSLLDGLTTVPVTPKMLWDDFHYVIDQMFINHKDDLSEIDINAVTTTILTDFGIASIDGLAGRFLNSYYKPITDQISLISGASEILAKAKAAGIKIGLVSNTIFPAAFHRREMERFGILQYFDSTIFSSEMGIRKPKKDIFLSALKNINANPETTVFVGDRLVEDVGGPQSVGIKGILKHVDGRDYSAAITPYRTIHKLNELEEIIL